MHKELDEKLLISEKKDQAMTSLLNDIQENERKAMAMEIHDGIGQSLTTIKFRIENFIKNNNLNNFQQESLKNLVLMLQDVNQEVNNIAMKIRPSILDDLGLITSIKWYCNEFQLANKNITIESYFELNEEKVPDTLKTVIYRILQETLHNIIKHSEATNVKIYLKDSLKQIELTIEDNGIGFSLNNILNKKIENTGLGLFFMKQRTEQTGGTFSINMSTESKGVKISSIWPELVYP